MFGLVGCVTVEDGNVDKTRMLLQSVNKRYMLVLINSSADI